MAHDRYEARDADPRLIAVLAAGAGAFFIAAPLLLSLIYVFPRTSQLSALPQLPQPRLQVAPADDLHALRSAEDAELMSYAWADRPNGAVRIPVARAMELIAQRGIPGWDTPAPDPRVPPRAQPGR